MLLRTLRRRTELAVRASLGCSRLHLARMLVIEGALLCLGGLAAGMLLSHLLLGAIAPLVEARLGRPAPGGTATIAVDGTVMLLLAVIGGAVAGSVSFLPLVAPWQRRPAGALRGDPAGGADGRAPRYLRASLIAFEIAGAMVLLAGCGLLVRSLASMLDADLGFQPEGLIRTRVVLRGADYPTPEAFFRFYERFTERLSQTTASPVVFATWPPFDDLPALAVEADGRRGEAARAGGISVGGGYFETLRIPLRRGRDFTAADVSGAADVAIVSETLARRLWPDGGALGRRIRSIEPTPAGPARGPWRTVVGVAADVRQAYGDPEVGDVYVPLSRGRFGRFGSFYTRTAASPAGLMQAARAVASEIDPRAVVDPPRRVTDENRQLAATALLARLSTGLAAVAGFLAIVGIYGVTAFAAEQRRREIGVRMALGSGHGALVRLFLREGAAIAAAGLTVGLLGAWGVGRLLQSELFAVRAFDVATLAVCSALLASAALLATWWPARRACRRNPLAVLKEG
jgi:predicted permease